MASFYKDITNNTWVLRNMVIPSGSCILEWTTDTNLNIKSFANPDTIYFSGSYIEFTKEDGTSYASKEDFINSVADFFVKTSFAKGEGSVFSVNTKTGDVTLTKSDFNLGAVDNTSDLNKPVSTATQNVINNLSKKGYTYLGQAIISTVPSVYGTNDRVYY